MQTHIIIKVLELLIFRSHTKFGKLDESIQMNDRALNIKPNDVAKYINKGNKNQLVFRNRTFYL